MVFLLCLTGCTAKPQAVQYECRPFSAQLTVQTAEGESFDGTFTLESDGASFTVSSPETLQGCVLETGVQGTKASFEEMEVSLPPETEPFLETLEETLRQADGQTVSGEHTLVLDENGYPLSLVLAPNDIRCAFQQVCPLSETSSE